MNTRTHKHTLHCASTWRFSTMGINFQSYIRFGVSLSHDVAYHANVFLLQLDKGECSLPAVFFQSVRIVTHQLCRIQSRLFLWQIFPWPQSHHLCFTVNFRTTNIWNFQFLINKSQSKGEATKGTNTYTNMYIHTSWKSRDFCLNGLWNDHCFRKDL